MTSAMTKGKSVKNYEDKWEGVGLEIEDQKQQKEAFTSRSVTKTSTKRGIASKQKVNLARRL